MSIQKLIALLLKDIRDNGPSEPSEGICHNLIELRWSTYEQDFTEAGYQAMSGMNILNFLQAVWVEWPHYSGCHSLPVPAPHDFEVEDEAEGAYYEAYHSERRLPKWHGEYGEMRLKLLDWLIEVLEGPTLSEVDKLLETGR